jgi:hypothetical protein
MGVKYLNKFQRNVRVTITTIPLVRLKTKTVVVDAYIYIQIRRAEQLTNGMEAFVRVLLKNEIVPVFIFDGKPPRKRTD